MEYKVVNYILKGREIEIAKEFEWYDKDGHVRTSNRVKRWLDSSLNSFDSLLYNCPESLKNLVIPNEMLLNCYTAQELPVFFGHYWIEDESPTIQASNAVCLDYSVAKGGSLVAYRWSGESTLHDSNFVFLKSEKYNK